MRVKDALDEVEATGYGIVMPAIEELSLEEAAQILNIVETETSFTAPDVVIIPYV